MKTSLFVSSLLALSACTIESKAAPPEPQQEYLSVTGTAKLEVDPDELDLSLKISVEAKKPQGAIKLLNGERDKLRLALADAGITDKNIVLSRIDLQPQFFPYPRNDKLRGYLASASVVVTLQEFSRSTEIIGLATENGVTSISSRFRSTRLPELKKQVRDKAAQAARDKAHQLASGFGTNLGAVVHISESAQGGAYSYYGNPGNVSQWNAVNYAGSTGSNSVRGTSQTISLSITVRYKLGGLSA